MSMTLKGFEEILPLILNFRRERDWVKFHKPKELATAISVESSELLELFLWRDREDARAIIDNDEIMPLIQEEIADILIYLLYLSYDLNIDLEKSVLDKMTKNSRKYPVQDYFGKFHDDSL